MDQKGYVCPTCKKTFTPLDVLHLEASIDTFICDVCHSPLTDNDESDGVKGSQDMMARLLMQTKHIIAGLKLTEDMTLPPFDIADWINKNVKAITQPIKELDGDDDGLAVAGTNSNSNSNKSQVKIQILSNENDDEQKRKLELEAQDRVQKNALPEWVLRSTISGEVTSIGHKNQMRVDKMNEDKHHSQTNDEGNHQINMDKYYEDYYANYNSLKRSQSHSNSPLTEEETLLSSNKKIKTEPDTDTTTVKIEKDNDNQINTNNNQSDDDDDDDDFEQVA